MNDPLRKHYLQLKEFVEAVQGGLLYMNCSSKLQKLPRKLL